MNRASWVRPFVLLASLASCSPESPTPDSPDTWLLVTIEGLGADETGIGGHPEVRTPHLDRLARTGLHAAEALSPSRSARVSLASALTGVAPEDHGLTHEEFALRDVPTIAESMRDHGLRRGGFVEAPAANGNHGLGRGLQRYDTGLDGPDALARSLESWLAEDRSAPAFVWLHLEPNDRGIGEVLRAVRTRTPVVALTSVGPERVPFVVAGPGVPPGELRLGPASPADAARLLTAAVAGDEVALGLPDPLDGPPRAPDLVLPPAVAGRLHEARLHDLAGRPEAARSAYEDALRAEPRLGAARTRAAELARRIGDSDAAARHAEALLERHPDHRGARIVLARVLAKQNARRATRVLEPVLAVSPDDPDATLAAAEVAIERGEPVVASRHYRRALAKSGDAPERLLDVGRGLSRLAFHREAIEAVERALDQGDRTPPARYTLAYVLERAERYQEAVNEYRRLIRDHPDYLPPYRNLGVLMARDGELERAIRLWEEALSRHPDDEGLRANIDAAREAIGSVTLGGPSS